MKTKHTPGPWKHGRISKSGFITITQQINVDDRLVIDLMVNENKEEAEANAKLIAAAPEMLEALQRCAKLMEQLHFPETEKQILAAINKATE